MRTNPMLKLAGVLALLGAAAAGAPPQASGSVWASQPNYYFCFANDHMFGTVWLTPLRPAGPDVDALQNEWIKYVKANLIPDVGQLGAQCGVGAQQAMAETRSTTAKRLYAKKVVEVDWSYWKGAETAQAATQLNEAARKGQWVICYSEASSSPIYVSGDIHLDVPPGPDPHANWSDGGASAKAVGQVQDDFLAYLKADYGYKSQSAYPASCTGNRPSAAALADIRERMHQRFPQLKFVETGWMPGKTPKPTAAPEATGPKPAPPPLAAQTAYEKALEAQRPKSNTPAPASPTAADDGKTYSFCSAVGHPPHRPSEAARSTYYLSAVFPAKPGEQPGAAFEKVLQRAHPEENVRGTTCTAPQARSVTESARETEIGARKGNPYITTLQVDWKP